MPILWQFLVRYGTRDVTHSILGGMLRASPADCAITLSEGHPATIDLCLDQSCGDFLPDEPHAHIPDQFFGLPLPDSSDDPRRAGLSYREARLDDLDLMRWDFYGSTDPRQTIYFVQKPLVV